jgi:hypothetical protein
MDDPSDAGPHRRFEESARTVDMQVLEAAARRLAQDADGVDDDVDAGEIASVERRVVGAGHVEPQPVLERLQSGRALTAGQPQAMALAAQPQAQRMADEAGVAGQQDVQEALARSGQDAGRSMQATFPVPTKGFCPRDPSRVRRPCNVDLAHASTGRGDVSFSGTGLAVQRRHGIDRRPPNSSCADRRRGAADRTYAFMPIYHVNPTTSPSMVVSTESAGAAAFRAGRGRDENPLQSADHTTGLPLDEKTRSELVAAWLRGWDRERELALCTSER